MRTERAGLLRHATVAKAMDYMLKRWDGFARFLDDDRFNAFAIGPNGAGERPAPLRHLDTETPL